MGHYSIPCPCCDVGGDCYTEGRSIGTFGGFAISPGCGSAGSDYFSLAGGASGTSTGGVGVTITGTTEQRQLGLGCALPGSSSDMGDDCEDILLCAGTGPVTITLTPPTGKIIVSAIFAVSNNTFGTNNSWTGTVNDTGGTATTSGAGMSVTTSAFSGFCLLSASAVWATAAIGESITSIEVSFENEIGSSDPYLAIGAIGFCCQTVMHVGRVMEDGGATRLLEDGTTYRLFEA